jgi:hypothetical protein
VWNCQASTLLGARTYTLRIWLRSASEQLGKTYAQGSRWYYGFDISADQFPVDTEGTSYSVQNMLTPFPEKHQNAFDLVHVRMITGGIPESQLKTAPTNLLPIISTETPWILALTFYPLT